MDTESKSRVVYENLDTTFVNLWALLRSLSQREFIGRVRVEMKDYTADVFMTGSNTPLVHEIDRAAGTDTLEEGALHRLVLRARETPGTISVFEGADEAIAVQSTAENKAVSVRENNPAGPSRDYADDALTETQADGQSVAIDPAPTPDREGPTLRDAAESRSAGEDRSSPKPAPALEPTLEALEPKDEIARDGIEWEAMVKASGELVSGVERALNNAGADFNSLFKAARLDMADDYTFLDPMSNNFTYASSVVTLNAEVSPGVYVAGLSEALRRVVDRVATGDRARRVRERVALELFSVVRKRKEILARSGFLSQLDRIAGTKVL